MKNTYPAVRYHGDGRTLRVETEAHDKTLAQDGWGPTPHPPAPEPEKRADVQAQLDELRDRVFALENVAPAEPPPSGKSASKKK